MLDSVGGSGVQSGTLPVPSMTNNQSESAKEKVCLNNNIGDSPKRKKKEEGCKIQDETKKKDPSNNEKEDRPESGIEVDDNVMQVCIIDREREREREREIRRRKSSESRAYTAL